MILKINWLKKKQQLFSPVDNALNEIKKSDLKFCDFDNYM